LVLIARHFLSLSIWAISWHNDLGFHARSQDFYEHHQHYKKMAPAITAGAILLKDLCHLIRPGDHPFYRSGRDRFRLSLKNDRVHAIHRINLDILFIEPGDHPVGYLAEARSAVHLFCQCVLPVAPVGQVAKGHLAHLQTVVVHHAKCNRFGLALNIRAGRARTTGFKPATKRIDFM
jgi:hypothetical protein